MDQTDPKTIQKVFTQSYIASFRNLLSLRAAGKHLLRLTLPVTTYKLNKMTEWRLPL